MSNVHMPYLYALAQDAEDGVVRDWRALLFVGESDQVTAQCRAQFGYDGLNTYRSPLGTCGGSGYLRG